MSHTCHAVGCERPCKPEYLMCGMHWRMVAPVLQRAVYKHYREGQCDDKDPSPEWCLAARRAINYVALREGKMTQEQADRAEARTRKAFGLEEE